MKERTAEDGYFQSFEVCMTNGSVLLRNKRFLKHSVKNVTFIDSDDEADHKDKKPDNADQAEERAAKPQRKS